MGDDETLDDIGDDNVSGDNVGGADEAPNKDESASEPPKSPEPLPQDVEKIMAQYPRVAGLFAGTATGTGPDGQVLKPKKTAAEAYDYAFVVALVKYRLRDVDSISTALKLRPDGPSAGRGDTYIASVITRALASADPIGGAAASAEGHAFSVEDVTVFDSDPPVFTLVIRVGAGAGVPITFDTTQLNDPRGFVTRCFEKLRKFVAIPDEWRKTVEAWMTSARVVTPPPEGTRQGSIVRAVRRSVGRLSLSDSLADIRDGRGVLAQQRGTDVVLFEIEAIMAALRSHENKPTVEDVAQALYKIGATHKRRTVTLGGRTQKTPKCWAIKAPKDLKASARPVATGPGGKLLPFPHPSQDQAQAPDVADSNPNDKDVIV